MLIIPVWPSGWMGKIYIDLPFPLVRWLQRWAEVYDRFLWPELGDNLDESDSRFTFEQQRLVEEVKKQLPHVEVVADEV